MPQFTYFVELPKAIEFLNCRRIKALRRHLSASSTLKSASKKRTANMLYSVNLTILLAQGIELKDGRSSISRWMRSLATTSSVIKRVYINSSLPVAHAS